MATTPAQIDVWLEERSEHHHLEFKEAKAQLDGNKMFRYCVALANEGGGTMLLGITDRLPRKVVGSAACANTLETEERIFGKLGFRVDVEEVLHPNGRVVVFHIPSRPRGTAYSLEGAYWMRSGEELVPMSEDRLRAIFDEGKPDWLEECSLNGLSSQQVVELLDVQRFFELIRCPYPTQQDGVLQRLLQDRLIDCYEYGAYGIRRMGALLLARRLEHFPDVARKAPRVIVYLGKSKLETKLEILGSKGYAVSFRGLVRFIMQQLPQNEIIEDALRRETKLLPEEAIRELVANALIHQDFLQTGASVVIELYEDRIDISNPGRPIVPVERFIDSNQSRNERLAVLMRRMGICEEKGSGTDRVINAVEVYQLPAPDFRATESRTSVTLYGPKEFDKMDREERVRACYQHAALRWVMSERMTNQSLRHRFSLSEDKSAIISQIIAQAIEAGMIKADEKVGASRRFARYLPFWA